MNKNWATILMIFGMMGTLATLSGGEIGAALTTAIMAFAGYYYRNKALKEEQKQQRFFPQQPPKIEINDDFLIRLANRLNKRLSVEDVVSQTSLNREEAKTRLENMALKGICEIRLNEVQNSGKIYYYFD